MDRAAAERALVNILRAGESCGMGFLAPGDRVVTARHCVNDALMTRERLVRISTFLNPAVSVEMVVEWFHEAVDVAVLKPKPGDEAAFRQLATHLRPAPVQFSVPPLNQDFAVHFLRHDAGWASGTARFIRRDQEMLTINSQPVLVVHKGTSGTPIFDDTGAVIGVMGMSAADADTFGGLQGGGEKRPPVFTALPHVLAPRKASLSPPPAEPTAGAEEGGTATA